MSIFVESGFANEHFIPKGDSENGERVGKWSDYSFEFIPTYEQDENDIIDEWYDHLLIRSEGKYVGNEKIGLWKFYALEGRVLKKYHIADVTFNNNEKNGPVTLFYSTGEKAAETFYKKGLMHGEYTVFYKTGEVARKYEMVKDTTQGELTFFYRTGERKLTMNFIDGTRTGESKGYYKNGDLKSTKTYVDDTVQGFCTYYYPNGKTREEHIYKDGVLTSLKYYYESGQLWISKVYRKGKYFNVLELYDYKGNYLDYGTLKDGTGTVKFYTHDAKVYLIRTYEDGEVINEEYFDEFK
jgi:antitoxin component YwqK of YwqJK toxin-antitoxin module